MSTRTTTETTPNAERLLKLREEVMKPQKLSRACEIVCDPAMIVAAWFGIETNEAQELFDEEDKPKFLAKLDALLARHAITAQGATT